MQTRNVIILTICALISTAAGGAITYYEQAAVNLQVTVMVETSK